LEQVKTIFRDVPQHKAPQILLDAWAEKCYTVMKAVRIGEAMAENAPLMQNKKAYHEYFILETMEAGVALCGTEVKSLRQGKCNLKDSWVSIENGQMLLKGMHISPYEHGNIFNREPTRDRQLLMHKREILRLFGKVKQDGLTLIPLKVYFKSGRAKVAVGLCKGKKLYDKRDVAAEKSAQRDMDRAIKER
jgi:SsrA-binding protein